MRRTIEASSDEESAEYCKLVPVHEASGHDRVVAKDIERGWTYCLSIVFLNCSSNLRPMIVVVSGVSPCDRSMWSLFTVSLAVFQQMRSLDGWCSAMNLSARRFRTLRTIANVQKNTIPIADDHRQSRLPMNNSRDHLH
jgi:hypothetical protein